MASVGHSALKGMGVAKREGLLDRRCSAGLAEVSLAASDRNIRHRLLGLLRGSVSTARCVGGDVPCARVSCPSRASAAPACDMGCAVLDDGDEWRPRLESARCRLCGCAGSCKSRAFRRCRHLGPHEFGVGLINPILAPGSCAAIWRRVRREPASVREARERCLPPRATCGLRAPYPSLHRRMLERYRRSSGLRHRSRLPTNF